MAQPPAYTPATDFSTDEAGGVSGRSTVRTANLDAEFSALQATLAAVLSNLAIIQRDDTALRDQTVMSHTLHPEVLALINSSLTPRGNWAGPGTTYNLLDLVVNANNTYICMATHSSSAAFATDQGLNRWMGFSYNLTADAEISAIAALSSDADRAPYFTAPGVAALMTVTSYARTLLDDADASTARSTLGVSALGAKNLILNGGFNHVQKPGITSANPVASAVTYMFQRWYAFQNGGITGHMTISQQAGPAADGGLSSVEKKRYPYCARILRDTTAVFTDSRFRTNLPAKIARLISGRALSIRFFARKGSGFSAASSQITCALVLGQDEEASSSALESVLWTGYNTHVAQPVTLTTSWQEFVINTVAVGTSFCQCALGFTTTWGAAVPNDYFEIAGVRMGVTDGAQDVPIWDETIDQDEMKCLEFYETLGTPNGGTHQYGAGFFVTASQAYINMPFKRKRIRPAITFSAAGDFTIQNATTNDAATVVGVPGVTIGMDRTRVNVTIAGVRTAGQGVTLSSTNGNSRFFIDAEL